MNKVTVVVPVYGDWPSLSECIESLKAHLPQGNSVLLVNDCGPEADVIENNIRASIKNAPFFRYERNAENMGFIGTCNRAAFELDDTDNDILLLNSDTKVTEGFLEEMTHVLYASDMHGCVSPRSNNATIATVPFQPLDGTDERTPEHAMHVYDNVKNDLERFHVVPVAPGFCMLIRRSLINNFGLFDPIYGLGYNEENDFCMRINQYGYSSVMANHAFVYHLESKSFTNEKRIRLDAANHTKLINRYPYFDRLVYKYINFDMDAVDWFCDAMVPAQNGARKLLIDLYHLPLALNGTARNCLSFLSALRDHSAVKDGSIVPTIVASKPATEYHKLGIYGFRVLEPHRVNEIFHVGVCPLQIFHTENLQLLNRRCLKVVYAHLDIIAIRSNHLLMENPIVKSVFEDAMLLADKIVAISSFAQADALAYYGDVIKEYRHKFVTIPQGYPDVHFAIDSHNLDTSKNAKIHDVVRNEGFILVFGNDLKHKFIKETLDALKPVTDRAIVVLGPRTIQNAAKNVTLIESGGLSDELLWSLYAAAGTVIFPSQYEGFGLPIAEAAKFNKKIVVADNSLNREVVALFDTFLLPRFFRSASELPGILKELDAAPSGTPTDGSLRTLTDYNDSFIDLVVDTLNAPVDVTHLRARWNYFNKIDQYMIKAGGKRGRRSVVERSANYLKSKNQRLYLLSRTIYRRTLKRKPN